MLLALKCPAVISLTLSKHAERYGATSVHLWPFADISGPSYE